MRLLTFIPAIICTVLLSCDAESVIGLDFSQPEVNASAPANRESNVVETSAVTVIFSKSMDRVKTADAFTLTSSSGAMKGYFSWDAEKKIMTFYPSKDLARGELYTISVTTDAEDREGNDLVSPYVAVFYVGGDTRPPTVLSVSPANDAQVPDPNLNMVIQFSEPIDVDTLYEGISISPPVQGRFGTDVTGRTVTFNPTYPLSWGTTYTVTVDGRLKDSNGNAIQDTYQFRFTVGDDFIAPKVDSVTQAADFNDPDAAETTGLNRTDDIVITFSEDIEEGTLMGAVTVSSPSDYYIVRDAVNHRIARIKFREPLESECHYTLKVSQGVTDLQGNLLDKEYVYRFFTNHPDALRPQVNAVLDENGDFLFKDMVNDLELAVNSTTYSKVTIRFDKAMDPHNIRVTMKRVMGAGTLLYRMVSPLWSADFKDYSFTMENVETGNVYSITVEGGEGNTADAMGNFLKEDSVWYLGF